MSETLEHPVRTFSFLSGDGDNTYGWEARNDEWVIPMIPKKMDEGYVFWIVRKTEERERQVRLKKASDTLPARSVIIRDEDARLLFEQGMIGVVARPVEGRSDQFVMERRARSAREAAENDTVAHRQGVGG